MANTANKQNLPKAEPSEAVSAYLSPAPSEVFTFRQHKTKPDLTGTVLEERHVRVRLIRLDQNHEAIAAAQRYAAERKDAAEHRDIYHEELAVQVAWRCLCRVDPTEHRDGTRYWQPLFASADHLRNSFSAAEIAQVLNMYEVVKAKFGTLEIFNDDEVDLWAERLSNTMLGEHFLALLDSSHWPPLLLSLAREVQQLREEVGRPLSTSPNLLGSDRESSDGGIGEFTELPSASLKESGLELPTDRVLTASEALQLVKRRQKAESGEAK